jgi:hypothetical protein
MGQYLATNFNLFLWNFRDALKQQYNLGQYFLEVSIEDIPSFDELLAHKLQKQPSDNLPLVYLLKFILKVRYFVTFMMYYS